MTVHSQVPSANAFSSVHFAGVPTGTAVYFVSAAHSIDRGTASVPISLPAACSATGTVASRVTIETLFFSCGQ